MGSIKRLGVWLMGAFEMVKTIILNKTDLKMAKHMTVHLFWPF